MYIYGNITDTCTNTCMVMLQVDKYLYGNITDTSTYCGWTYRFIVIYIFDEKISF